MTDGAFMSIKLSGGRFKGDGLPFFVLEDLAPLQDMVVDVAKWLYREEHGRKRPPPDFDQTCLKITGLRGGNAAVIGVDAARTIPDGLPAVHRERFATASNNIVKVIGLAEQDAVRLTGLMPPQCLMYFKRVGGSLAENEVMEMTSANRRTARLTPHSREVLTRHHVEETTGTVTVRGAVSEVDLKNARFRLEPIHGAAFDCQFSEQHRGVVLEALASYKNNEYSDKVRVQLQTTGAYGQQGRLQSVETVRSINALDPLDVHARLDEFRNLQDGWLEGGGVGQSHAGLDWLSDVFDRYYPDDLPLPYTYPMADGGVILEWNFGIRNPDVEINIESHTGEWYVFNSDTKSGEEEKAVKLDGPDGWAWVCERLRDIMPPGRG